LNKIVYSEYIYIVDFVVVDIFIQMQFLCRVWICA